MARGVHFQIGIAGFLIFIATAKGTDTAVQDAMTPNPYALPSSIGSDPSKELTDAPIPGQKSADGTAPVSGDSQELSPFYVRTGVG